MAFNELTSTMAQVPLINGCTAVFEAIDPTSGNAVSGVKIKNPVVYGHDLTPPTDEENAAGAPAPPFMLVPGPGAGPG